MATLSWIVVFVFSFLLVLGTLFVLDMCLVKDGTINIVRDGEVIFCICESEPLRIGFPAGVVEIGSE